MVPTFAGLIPIDVLTTAAIRPSLKLRQIGKGSRGDVRFAPLRVIQGAGVGQGLPLPIVLSFKAAQITGGN